MKHINSLAILLLLIIIAVSSACSSGKINAQSPSNNKPETAKNNNPDSTKSTYKEPKRVSKDVLK